MKTKIWDCKIGEALEGDLEVGADFPMRQAIKAAYIKLVGREPDFLFSGWAGELTDSERWALNPDKKEPQAMCKRTVETQSAEFDAAAEFAKQVRRLELTAIVDDDYPAIRHDYEGALRSLIVALHFNGREWPFDAPERIPTPPMRLTPVSAPDPDPPESPCFLTRLRLANRSRMPRFGHGDIDTPAELGGWTVADWGNAIAGETGELCNLLKKYKRQHVSDPKPDELIPDIADEIADVITYLDLLAEFFGLSLPHIIASKFNRVSKKFSWPERLEL